MPGLKRMRKGGISMDYKKSNRVIFQDNPITMGQIKEEFERILDGARMVDSGEWSAQCFIGYVRELSESVIDAIEFCYGDAKNGSHITR